MPELSSLLSVDQRRVNTQRLLWGEKLFLLYFCRYVCTRARDHLIHKQGMGTSTTTVYNRQALLLLREQPETNLQDDLLQTMRELCLLREPDLQPSVLPESGDGEKRTRKRCSRKHKRGKRAGVSARLKGQPKPASTTIPLECICSLENKLDCIKLQRTTQREYRDGCVLVFTKTWLS